MPLSQTGRRGSRAMSQETCLFVNAVSFRGEEETGFVWAYQNPLSIEK